MAKKKREKLGAGPILLWIFVLVLIVVLFFLINSSLFNVTKIVVKGNNQVPSADIISCSGINGDVNILHVDEAAAKESIENNLFKVVVDDIYRTFPTGVEIVVHERTEIAQIGTGNGYYVIDEEGVTLGLNPMPVDGLISIHNLSIYEPNGGQKVESDSPEKLEGALMVLEAIKKYGLNNEILGIDVSDPQGILLTYKGDIKIKIASGLTAEQKIKDIKATVEAVKNIITEGQVIHMETSGHYYISSKQ